ncbi:MAG: hypothetical protein RL021_1400 [Bacteroidota bacterium]|jgi:uncharacterized Ntn-hydrolase superfamily protein
MKPTLCIFLLFIFLLPLRSSAQDTFSIVAIDSVTGEVGSAGASCVDLILNFPTYPIDFLGDLFPGQGAINTQASYNVTNQNNARTRMLAGDTPQQIVNWLTANDAGNNPNIRQYGIAAFVNGSPQTAGHTGTNTLNYKNHIAGPNYCIQGNILLGQSVLDSMESRFLNAPGDLACKLMAALQGAKVVGADTRCASNNSSSLFAFLKVAQPTDSFGSPSFLVRVKTPGGAQIEPIDSLQRLFDSQHSCANTTIPETGSTYWKVYPNPVGDRLTVETLNANGLSDDTRYRLTDAHGRCIRKAKIRQEKQMIDLADLAPGVYVLEVVSNDQRFVRRVVKQ